VRIFDLPLNSPSLSHKSILSTLLLWTPYFQNYDLITFDDERWDSWWFVFIYLWELQLELIIIISLTIYHLISNSKDRGFERNVEFLESYTDFRVKIRSWDDGNKRWLIRDEIWLMVDTWFLFIISSYHLQPSHSTQKEMNRSMRL